MAEKRLTTQVAESFLADSASVNLSVFTTLDDDAAEILSKHRGRLRLFGLSRSLSKHKGNICLYGLESLSHEVADGILRHKGELELVSVTNLSDKAAEHLTHYDGYQILLGSLVSLSDSAARTLAKYPGELDVDLDALPSAAAEQLRKHSSFRDYVFDTDDTSASIEEDSVTRTHLPTYTISEDEDERQNSRNSPANTAPRTPPQEVQRDDSPAVPQQPANTAKPQEWQQSIDQERAEHSLRDRRARWAFIFAPSGLCAGLSAVAFITWIPVTLLNSLFNSEQLGAIADFLFSTGLFSVVLSVVLLIALYALVHASEYAERGTQDYTLRPSMLHRPFLEWREWFRRGENVIDRLLTRCGQYIPADTVASDNKNNQRGTEDGGESNVQSSGERP